MAYPTAAASIAALKVLTGLSNNDVVMVEGYYNAGDGGGGDFYWDASSTDSDNGGTIIQLNGGGTGRFKRIIPGTWYNTPQTTLDVRWFGAIPDYATDVHARVDAAYAAIPTNGCGCLYFPAGNYVFNAKSTLVGGNKSICVRGDGVTATRFLYNNHSDAVFEIGVAVEMCEIGFVNIDGTTNNNYVVILSYGPLSKFHHLRFEAFYNIICLKISNSFADVHDVVMNNHDGCQLWIELSGGLVSHCFLTAGDANGLSRWPCVVVRGLDGGPLTSLRFSTCTFKGNGPWSSYDGGTAKITMVVTNDGGTVNESSIQDVLFDTTSGSGNQANTICLLFDGVSSASGRIGGWQVSNIYGNGGQETVRIHGRDLGATEKTVEAIHMSQIYTLPPNGVPGVHIIGAREVEINGLFTRGNGGATGVLIEDGGQSHYTEDVFITGMTSNPTNPNTNGIVVSGSNVRSVTALFTNTSGTNAYVLQSGASKSNGLLFLWPNGSGGLNCSGSITQNV